MRLAQSLYLQGFQLSRQLDSKIIHIVLVGGLGEHSSLHLGDTDLSLVMQLTNVHNALGAAGSVGQGQVRTGAVFVEDHSTAGNQNGGLVSKIKFIDLE